MGESAEQDRSPRSLAEVPLALARIRPRVTAPREEWPAFYGISAGRWGQAMVTEAVQPAHGWWCNVEGAHHLPFPIVGDRGGR